jgi:hypothetical protein
MRERPGRGVPVLLTSGYAKAAAREVNAEAISILESHILHR